MEETVEEVGDTEVAKFLTLIRGIVVLDSKSASNSQVFNCRSDEDSDTTGSHFRDEVSFGHCWGLLTLGLNLDNFKEKVIRVSVLVDSVTDASEEHQSQECSCRREEPDDFVVFAPSLTRLLKNSEEQDSSEANEACPAIGIGEFIKDIVDLLCCTITDVVFTEQ